MFNPLRPYLLYAAFRREDAIYSWDVRGDVGRPIQIFNREAADSTMPAKRKLPATNQRLRFDIDIGGDLLGVGDQVRVTHANLYSCLTDCSGRTNLHFLAELGRKFCLQRH